MPDELETMLRLVAEGKLTPDEAAPIIAAIQAGRGLAGSEQGAARSAAGGDRARESSAPEGSPLAGRSPAGWSRSMRIRVIEDGRPVVDVRVPLALAGLATDRVPGLSDANRARIRQALDEGLVGPILEIRDGSDEVRIVVE